MIEIIGIMFWKRKRQTICYVGIHDQTEKDSAFLMEHSTSGSKIDQTLNSYIRLEGIHDPMTTKMKNPSATGPTG